MVPRLCFNQHSKTHRHKKDCLVEGSFNLPTVLSKQQACHVIQDHSVKHKAERAEREARARASMVFFAGGSGKGKVNKLSRFRVGRLSDFSGFWAVDLCFSGIWLLGDWGRGGCPIKGDGG